MPLFGTPALLVLGSVALADDPFREQFPAEAIRRFDIDLPAGDVTIRAVEPLGLVEVVGRPAEWASGCTVDMSQDAERAWVRVASAAPLVRCRLDLAITLGAATIVTVHVGNGDVRVIDLAGDLTADVGAGDLSLEGMVGALDVEVGSGAVSGGFGGPRLRAEIGSGGVHLRRMVAPADIELGMGNVELIYAVAPTGSVSARTGTGSVKVLLPDGTPVDADLTVGIGGKRVELAQLEDAATRLDLTTAVGRITVAATPPEPSDEPLDAP